MGTCTFKCSGALDPLAPLERVDHWGQRSIGHWQLVDLNSCLGTLPRLERLDKHLDNVQSARATITCSCRGVQPMRRQAAGCGAQPRFF